MNVGKLSYMRDSDEKVFIPSLRPGNICVANLPVSRLAASIF